MPTSDLSTSLSAIPEASPNFVDFGEQATAAASLRYDLPLPGSFPIGRVSSVPLEDDDFMDTADGTGTSLADLGVVVPGVGGAPPTVDQAKLATWFDRIVPDDSHPSLFAAANVGVNVSTHRPFDQVVSGILAGDIGGAVSAQLVALLPALPGILAALPPAVWARMLGHDFPDPRQDDIETRQKRRKEYVDGLAKKQTDGPIRVGTINVPLYIPAEGMGTTLQTVPVDLNAAMYPEPRIAVVEMWQLSTLLGDYGLGRTVNTFSLLPGEHTTITVQTWATDSATKTEATSIFDSADHSAQTRFTDQLARSAGTTTTETGGWAASAGVKTGASAQVYVVNMNAEIEASASANHQEGRTDFANNLKTSSSEHAAQANTARRTAVEKTASTEHSAGAANETIRELSNTNLRRVLNFVFRELNQQYDTVTSLRDVQLAFFNGRPGSLEIVGLSALPSFLAKYIEEPRRDVVARKILALLVQCVDEHGEPQTMLQVGTRTGGVFDWQDAALNDDGELDFADSPLERKYSWRIKPGPVGQNGQRHPVAGVVTQRSSVALRTDSVVVEALLGVADALDPYATGLQALDLRSRQADLEWREVETRKTAAALNLVENPDEAKVSAWERMLKEPPQIEVVPAAAAASEAPRR